MMSNVSTRGFVLGALICAGCGNGEASSPPGDPFAGKWSCADDRSLTFAMPSGSSDAHASSRSIVAIATDGTKLTAVAQTEAGARCSLAFSEIGGQATLASGQSCDGQDGLTLTYTAGTATLGASGLQSNLAFDFSGMMATSAGSAPVAVEGNGVTASVCSKIVQVSSGPPGGGGW
jgi:hypothetical protein